MSDVALTATVDTSALQRLIPKFMEVSTRTLRQQCITSMAFICFDAQEMTPAADISRIDSDLEVTVTPRLSTKGKNKGNPLKSGKKDVNVPDMSMAMMIAIARLHPNSAYSRSTGNRWPVAMPQTEGKEEFMDYMAKVAARMVSARHSSTHYLKTGWTPAIRKLLSDPDYRYFKGGLRRGAGKVRQNQLNKMSPEGLGMVSITTTGSSISITAENDVGEGGNEVLNAKHRAALIKYGFPAAQRAIENETAVMLAELQSRLQEQYNRIQDDI